MTAPMLTTVLAVRHADAHVLSHPYGTHLKGTS